MTCTEKGKRKENEAGMAFTKRERRKRRRKKRGSRSGSDDLHVRK